MSKEQTDLSIRKGNPADTSQDQASNFKVVIRVRPPLPREVISGIPFQSDVIKNYPIFRCKFPKTIK